MKVVADLVYALTGRAPHRRVKLDVEVVSEANKRGHWRPHHERHSTQRTAVALQVPNDPCPLPCAVVFYRVMGKGQRAFDPEDNAPVAFKAIRDEVAKKLGVDDRASELVTWIYGPEERADQPAVWVEFWPIVRD